MLVYSSLLIVNNDCDNSRELCDIITERKETSGYTEEKQNEGAMIMIEMNREMFEKKMMENDRPVLVEFWAPWCVYCRRIGPALEKVSRQYDGQMVVGKVNIDEEPILAHREQIEVIPTLILYRGGEALGSIVAPESKAKIEEFIRETLEN